MKLSFKTLQNKQFELELAEDASIAAVKQAVATHQQNDDAASRYRLIYSGKVLKDADTLATAGVQESGFLVVMPPSKAKSKPADEPPATEPSTTRTPAAAPAVSAPAAGALPSEYADIVMTDAPSTLAPSTAAAISAVPSATVADTASAGAASSLLTGSEYDASVARLVEMGFSEEQVKKAMRAAFNNPERAVEYLFNGIPEMPDAQPAPAPSAALAATTAPTTGRNAPGGGATVAEPAGATPGTPFDMFAPPGAAPSGGAVGVGGGGNLDFLRQLPQFNMMRRMIQANPGLLAQLIQQLDQANPALLQVINANQSEFVQLINEPVPPGDEAGGEAMEQLAAAMADAGAPGGDGGPGAAAQGQIFVTEEENQMLIRLTELGQSMGLERVHVVEAWLACDRDENLAGNYLIEHSADIKEAQEEDAAAQTEQDNPPPGDNAPPPS
jgi:UV excision repair protein RAD23